jgi:hypothetical protein
MIEGDTSGEDRFVLVNAYSIERSGHHLPANPFLNDRLAMLPDQLFGLSAISKGSFFKAHHLKYILTV